MIVDEFLFLKEFELNFVVNLVMENFGNCGIFLIFFLVYFILRYLIFLI